VKVVRMSVQFPKESKELLVFLQKNPKMPNQDAKKVASDGFVTGHDFSRADKAH